MPDTRLCEEYASSSAAASYSISPMPFRVPDLDYNRLKVRVLELLSGRGELASEQILKLLQNSGAQLSDKGLKMALMRYTRQGLLARVKRRGRYHYSITAKGSARRDWLLKTK